MIDHDVQLEMNNVDEHDDQLWKQLKSIPAFRGLLRAVEARFYQELDLAEPVLDLGCGDGHFARMTFDKPMAVGIDPWWGPLQKAQRSGMYDDLVFGMGNDMPFPDETFATVISNSVLEHIPDIQPVLNEASRVLQENGRLVITMPTHYFTAYMGGAAMLEKIGATGLAAKYRDFFNFISRHVHTDPPELWAERLAKAGFEIERWQYYFSKEALRALEWGHVQGVPSAIIHAITGHWIIAPWQSSLRRTERWLRPFYEEPFNPDEGAYMLIIARKKTNHAIEAPLPPAEPFNVEAMLAKEVISNQFTVRSPQSSVLSPQSSVPNPQSPIPKAPHQPCQLHFGTNESIRCLCCSDNVWQQRDESGAGCGMAVVEWATAAYFGAAHRFVSTAGAARFANADNWQAAAPPLAAAACAVSGDIGTADGEQWWSRTAVFRFHLLVCSHWHRHFCSF